MSVLLPPLQSPTVPYHVHVAEEGAVRASACARGGGGVCAHGAYPSLQPAGGRGRWAPRGACGALGTLPSEPERKKKRVSSVLHLHLISSLC